MEQKKDCIIFQPPVYSHALQKTPLQSHNTTLCRPSLAVWVFQLRFAPGHVRRSKLLLMACGDVVVLAIYAMVDPLLGLLFLLLAFCSYRRVFGQRKCISCRYQYFWLVGPSRTVRGISHALGQKNQYVPKPLWLSCKDVSSVCSIVFCHSWLTVIVGEEAWLVSRPRYGDGAYEPKDSRKRTYISSSKF